MGFFLKKLITALIMPLPGCLILLGLGVVLWSRGRKRLGRWMVLGAVALLYLTSLYPVSNALIRAVESDAPPFPGDSVGYVVVLGGGHSSDPSVPLSGRLSTRSVYRLTEGMAIATAQPWARLVLSGYGGADPVPNARMYHDVAVALGFPSARMLMEPRPRDTAEEAELLEPLLRGQRFALVTSASHMDRALALFRARGLDPIPAPTGHMGSDAAGAFTLLDFFPDGPSLLTTQVAWYEFLGRVWARLTGRG